MIEVRNTLFQPLTFHLAKGPTGMQEGLHLGPRERRRIRQDQLSPEIEKAAGRGLIALVYLPDELPAQSPNAAVNNSEPTGTDPTSMSTAGITSADNESSATGAADDQSPSAGRKRR
jgi:hypothetical protein